jgi:peptide/nickel transport system substrate-binding protein
VRAAGDARARPSRNRSCAGTRSLLFAWQPGEFGRSPGFLRIGTIAALNSLNPWVTTDQLSLDVQSDIYPRLIQYNLSTMTFEPDFASSWTQSDGGRIARTTILTS